MLRLDCNIYKKLLLCFMNFTAPLITGRLLKRYKRFMADVLLEDGNIVTAHCANSGSMKSVAIPNSPVWISPAQNPKRKLIKFLSCENT